MRTQQRRAYHVTSTWDSDEVPSGLTRRPAALSESQESQRRTTLVPPPLRRSQTTSSLDELEELHATMALRVVRLEAVMDDVDAPALRTLLGSYLRSSWALRDLLVRVSVMTPELDASAGSLLIQSIRWAYWWAIEQLEAVLGRLHRYTHFSSTSTIPRDVLAVFHDLVGTTGVRDGTSPANDPLKRMLLTIDDTLAQLMEKQDRIQDLLGG